MQFKVFSQFLEKIEKTQSRLEITHLLADLFKQATPDEVQQAAHLVLGEIAPPYEEKKFGLAERLVLKAMVNAFSLEPGYAKRKSNALGDLGIFAQEERSKNQSLFGKEEDRSVSQVFTQLVSITQRSGNGSQEEKMNTIALLLSEMDPLSCRYLARILVGTLRLGFSAMTILDAYSWMLTGDKQHRAAIEKAYNVHPNIGYIGKLLRSKGIQGLSSAEPEVGVPVLMARAERVETPEDIIEKMGECAVEPKYDGFRLQLHYDKKNGVKLYTRSLEDVSHMYPDIVAAARSELRCDSAILEGEAVGFNPTTKEYLPFQETVQRKRKYDIAAKALEIPLRLFVFELLELNGKSHLNTPYIERRKYLQSIVHTTEDATIAVTTITQTTSAHELETLFQEYISEGLEGIIAKKLDGTYQAGARGWNWIKFKRSYSSKINDTLDCVVMGFDYGKGKRTGFGIGAFLVGVYNLQQDRFETIAKIGTGLTDEEWKTLRGQCEKHVVAHKPKNFVVHKIAEPDVWVAPQLVVEIRADEITRSPMHTAYEIDGIGYALRFPRLERFRSDKKPDQASTIDEVKRLFGLQKH